MRSFATRCFGELWAVEADRAFNHSPITAYVATDGAEIGGFAVYECTRRGFFGPTGVREDLRGKGIGAALLFRCLQSMLRDGIRLRRDRRRGPGRVLREGLRRVRHTRKRDRHLSAAARASRGGAGMSGHCPRAQARILRVAAHSSALRRLG